MERFCSFGLRYNPTPIPYHLHKTGEIEFYSLSRVVALAVSGFWKNQDSEAGDLKVVNLFVPESNLAELNTNLPHSGYQYVKGSLWHENKLQKMKFRYRGDYVYHWGYRKKSFRVKTSKKKLYEDTRAFNLIAPKQLETHFGCLLAREMGLIAPRTDLVEVTLNGKLLGPHAYVEQLEELTLRKNGRMPGDLYAGEAAAKDTYRGVGSQIFNHPQLWEKIAINNHYNEESRKPLERLLELINDPNIEQAQSELTKLIDIEAWGKFTAFETLSQSFHYDNIHNWRLYYDPMKSLFYPVIWDPAGWTAGWVPKNDELAQLDIIPSTMHQFLFKNADILRARAQALGEFFNYGTDKTFLQKVDLTLPALKRSTIRDPLDTSPDATLARIDSFRSRITKVFSDVKKSYLKNTEPVKYALKGAKTSDFHVTFAVSGRIPVNKLRLSFANSINGPIGALLNYRANGENIEKDISGAISMSGSMVEVSKTLISRHYQIEEGNHPLQKRRLQTGPAYYGLTLSGVNPSNRLIDISVDYGGGEMALAEHVPDLEESPFADLYNIVDTQPIEVAKVWQGVVDILEVTEISMPLLIEPGTVVRFAPGASLLLRGRLLAEGTEEQPISFIALKAGQEPWGTVTLIGNEANGSRLNHVEFNGGSGLKGDLFEYTAMFSIHDVKGVVVENCTFRDSKITDDMVHAVYAEVRFSDCLFERSLMDALDIDISDAVIERSHFVDSGNDSIDLMTSNAVVLDTVIENSGDKAASVGEGSYLLAINNMFRNNLIGVQAKDGSVAALYNMDLVGNGHALDAYKKNWRYNDGGNIYLYKSRIVGNPKMITADKKSAIRAYDCYIDRPVETKKKRLKLAKTVDSDAEKNVSNPKLIRSKKEIEFMKHFDSKYWDRVDVGRRGFLNFVNH